MTEPSKTLGEFGSIAAYLAPLAGPEGLGLLDDAALYTPPPGQTLVFTKDAMVAGVHFFADDAPSVVASKLARVNLSDLAAMGAEPLGYLMAVALPKEGAGLWMQGLSEGFAEAQSLYGWTLWGGDTVTTSGPVTLSLTAIGQVPAGQALLRSGARAGDRIYVSGTVGDAALGLLGRRGELAGTLGKFTDFLLDRLYRPSPRLALGQALRGLASAAQDVSDGLVADLGHIAKASKLMAHIHRDRIPLSEAARDVITRYPERQGQIFAGDDYELIFTVAPARVDEVEALGRRLGLSLTEIGSFQSDGVGVRLFHEDGREDYDGGAGYRHF